MFGTARRRRRATARRGIASWRRGRRVALPDDQRHRSGRGALLTHHPSGREPAACASGDRPGSVNLGESFAYVNSVPTSSTMAACATRSVSCRACRCSNPDSCAPTRVLARGQAPARTAALLLRWREAEADGGSRSDSAPTERASMPTRAARRLPLPWSVTVVGGDLFAPELPELALARGGHLRVGLEDHRGRSASNEELSPRPSRRCARRATARRLHERRRPVGLKPRSRPAPLGRRQLRYTVRPRRTPREERHARRRPDPGEHR